MRIGINVPNDLLKRMEPLKKITNVSQVCRDAIQAWVDMYERAKERASQDGMEKIAFRLRQEFESYKVDWESLGHEDAKLWAQIATLKEFEHLFHNVGVAKRKGRIPGLWCAPILSGTRDYPERQHEHKEWFARQIELDEDAPNPYLRAEEDYEKGWISYLTAVWDMVKRGAVVKEEMRPNDGKQE